MAQRDLAMGPSPYRWALLLILTLACLVRVLNLGGFSLWLDEILQTIQTRGSFGEALVALRHDPDHPPLDGLISWVVLQLGAGETGHRLVHVLWGVLTIGLLMTWAARRWFSRAALVVGLLAGASPFHVRYSQEIRPYALSLLLLTLALYALDCVLEEPVEARRWRSWTVLVLTSAGVFYSSHVATICLLTIAAAWILARSPRGAWPAVNAG